jgi:HEAT repeat protein
LVTLTFCLGKTVHLLSFYVNRIEPVIPSICITLLSCSFYEEAQKAEANMQAPKISLICQRIKFSLLEMYEKMFTRQAFSQDISALRHNDLRGLQAVSNLVDAGTEAVVPLIKGLSRSDSLAKRRISLILGKSHDPRALQPLLQLLEDSDWSVRDAAATALARLDGFELLSQALKSKNPQARQAAIIGLGSISGERVVAPLMAALDDPATRADAAGILKRIAPLESAPILHQFLGSEEFSLQSSAFDALATASTDMLIEAVREVLPATSIKARQSLVPKLGQIRDKRMVAILVSLLNDSDHSIRAQAVWQFYNLRDADAVLPVVKMLDDPVMQVRRSAAWVLGRFGDWRATPALIDQLGKDKERYSRAAAAEALGVLGDPRAVEPLITALHDPEDYVRSHAAVALGKLGDKRALAPLLSTMAIRDNAWSVAKVLADFGGNEIIPQMLEALSSENPDKCQLAILTVGHHLRSPEAVEPFIKLLEHSDKNTRILAAVGLQRIGDKRALPTLLKLLKQNGEQYPSLIYSLARIKDEAAFEELIRLLNMGDWTSDAAAQALGSRGDERAVEPLIEMLRNQKNARRFVAARTLGRLKDTRAIEPLMEHINLDAQNQEQPRVAVWPYVVWALGEMRVGQAVPRLVQLLHIYNNNDRGDMSIPEALGKIGDAQAVPELIRTLDQRDESSRAFSAWALGKLGDKQAVEPLMKAATARSSFVRYYTIGALSRLGDPQAFDVVFAALLSGDQAIRRLALQGLSQMNDMRALEVFLVYLDDDQHVLRNHSLQGLVHLGTAAVPSLLNTFAIPDRPERFRRRIVRVLGLIGDARAVPDLITCLQSDPASQVRAEAAHALGRIGDLMAAKVLMEALDAPTANVRASAATALGRLKYFSAQDNLTRLSNDPNLNAQRAAAAALQRLSD